jgi:RNA polymerase sigma-70 factor (ECF subfamily)
MGRDDDPELAKQAARARDGDSEAWGYLYERLAPTVYRLCLRALARPEDAEDATEEVFLKVRVRLSQYDTSRPFTPWLYRVAANHCWDELRKRRTGGAALDADFDLPDEKTESVESTLLTAEARGRVREAIARLPDRPRLVLVLRYFADMSYTEIASVLQVSDSLVGVMLLRARRRLRKELATKNGNGTTA